MISSSRLLTLSQMNGNDLQHVRVLYSQCSGKALSSMKVRSINFFSATLLISPAHSIRNPSSLTFKAVCSIRSQSRWAATGTPVQNKMTELSSLFAFFRVHPYSDPDTFDKDITQIWKEGKETIAIDRLERLLAFIMLRRSGDTIDLPPRQDFRKALDFSPDELNIYDRKCRETRRGYEQWRYWTWLVHQCPTAYQCAAHDLQSWCLQSTADHTDILERTLDLGDCPRGIQ